MCSWENLRHIFVQQEDRDALKAHFGYTAVPFYVVFDKEGNVLKSGEPKSIDLLNTLKAASGASTFTLDEDF